MKKAVFMDRDGTMGPMSKVEYPQQLKAFDHLNDAIRQVQEKGYLAIAITNQSCIARGKANGYDYDKEFQSYGLDDWFICPHDDIDACNCRKPAPGLILQAKEKYNLDLKKSFMIGDRWSDIHTGKACGCHTVLVLTGRGKQALEQRNPESADFVAKDIFEAIQWICSEK